ncbi:alpha/beta hydrolase family protein [Aquabacter sediminis]|uniref:alpha/beta hydrolase family protein n=1 Tax=Aquabacter sediminis TaxID=3029197 RepID=UPI003CCFDFE4
MVRACAVIVCLLLAAACPAWAAGPLPEAGEVGTGVRYERIDHWDAARLNRVLTADAPKFFGVAPAYSPARTGVTLYRITYPSVIPEQGNRPTTASGLLAIPDEGGSRFPLFSYQHGTVYGKEEVPSFPDQSPETQLALAQFGGQGYVVIGADYFGMGTSRDPQGYLVKASQQQAPFDMLLAARAVLAAMKIETPKLFLGGWSQGGFVTMALLEKLEAAGVPVTAAATASAPVDGFMVMNGFLQFPRRIDAGWVNSLFILSAFSFEAYYGLPGLAQSLLTDEAYEASRAAYENRPFDPAKIPTDLRKLVRADYFDTQFFARSAYGRILKDTTAYRWVIRTPVRNYYGEADEVITPGLGRLAMTWQSAMGAGNGAVEAISTGPTTHRGTYATSITAWKAWFDGL